MKIRESTETLEDEFDVTLTRRELMILCILTGNVAGGLNPGDPRCYTDNMYHTLCEFLGTGSANMRRALRVKVKGTLAINSACEED